MKYDIAKDEDGPLRLTLRTEQPLNVNTEPHAISADQNALDSGFRDVEDHLAVRYGALVGMTFPETWCFNGFPSSPLTSEFDRGQAQILRRSHHTAREGISVMGYSTSEPTKSRGGG